MPCEEVAMLGSILAVFASGVIVVASLFVLWGLGQARTDVLGKTLLLAVCVFELLALAFTWIWAAKWRTLGLISPWRFVTGPRPAEPAETSAWRWGRRAWLSWFAIIVCVLAFALTHSGSR